MREEREKTHAGQVELEDCVRKHSGEDKQINERANKLVGK